MATASVLKPSSSKSKRPVLWITASIVVTVLVAIAGMNLYWNFAAKLHKAQKSSPATATDVHDVPPPAAPSIKPEVKDAFAPYGYQPTTYNVAATDAQAEYDRENGLSGVARRRYHNAGQKFYEKIYLVPTNKAMIDEATDYARKHGHPHAAFVIKKGMHLRIPTLSPADHKAAIGDGRTVSAYASSDGLTRFLAEHNATQPTTSTIPAGAYIGSPAATYDNNQPAKAIDQSLLHWKNGHPAKGVKPPKGSGNQESQPPPAPHNQSMNSRPPEILRPQSP